MITPEGKMLHRGHTRYFDGVYIRPTLGYDDTREGDDYWLQLRILDLKIEPLSGNVPDFRKDAIKKAVKAKFIGQPSWTWRLWVMHEDDYYLREPGHPVDVPVYPEYLLGDLVEDVLRFFRIHQAVIATARAFKFSCGCAARKQWLNNLHKGIILRRHLRKLNKYKEIEKND